MRALVIGGGIAGLTAANALTQAGWDVSVFEREGDLRKLQVGAGIHMWPNAMMAFERLGLDRQIAEAGSPERRMLFLSWRGKLLADWPIGEVADRLGQPAVSVERGKIHKVLADALGPSALELGRECLGFEQADDAVVARFSDGREERGDLLLGADGLRSVVRTGLFGESPPRYRGYTAWQALVDTTTDAVPLEVMPAWWGPGQRFLTFYTSPERMQWVAIRNAPEGHRDRPEELKPGLLDLYGGWPEPTEELIEATPHGRITRLDIYDRKPVGRWSVGRVTLLGDAAHPMTFDMGQGACTGIEDGLTLARHLRIGGDPVEALQAYERERAPRTATISKLSGILGQGARLENRAACAVRERIMKTFFTRIAFRNFSRFVSHRV